MKERLTKSLKNKLFKNYLVVFISIFLIEIIFKLVSDSPLIDWATFRILISSSILSLIVAIPLSFANNLISKITNLVLIGIISFYAILQAGFLNFLGVYMSLGTSSQLGAVTSYITDYLGSFKLNFFLILIPFILLVIYYIFFDNKFREDVLVKPKRITKKYKEEVILLKKQRIFNRSLAGVILLFLLFFYGLTINIEFMQNKLQISTNALLFKSPSLPNIAVNQFGIFTYGILDVKSTVLPSKEIEDEEIFTPEEIDTEITDNSRIIDDTAWLALNEAEVDSNYKKLNDYFLTRRISDKNEYTGIFQDKNLIVIMLESVNNLIINKDLFPNFYKLYSEGWSWENSYSPRNACSTGNNEMSSVVSLFTINNVCTANRYKSNTYFESLYNIFGNAGYTATSYHDYSDSYYYRRTIHPNMGSSKYYDIYNLGIKNSGIYSDWPSDLEFMQKAVPLYINQDKFFSYMITVTPHQTYGNSSPMGDLYMNEFNDIPGISTSLKRYYSKLKVLDLALGDLIQQLTDSGKLEDTVIALFADHYPYGIRAGELQKMFDYEITDRKEIDKTPFVIYNPTITPTVFSDYTTYMNITPTLANLFGINYDPRLYMGEDLFDKDARKIAIFADGSWQSSIAYYESTTGKITYMDSSRYTDSEILEINKLVSNKIKMSNLAITTNYFNYLNNKLYK